MWGASSAFTLNPLLVYADRDDAKELKDVLRDAGAKPALDTVWNEVEVDGKPLLPVFSGLVGDTKWIWACLRRTSDKGWTKGLGGTFRSRKVFMETDDNGVMTCVHVCVCVCSCVSLNPNPNMFL